MKKSDYEPSDIEAKRLSELSVLDLQLDRRVRAVELADLALTIAKKVRKPGARYEALRSIANTYSELGLYDKAVDATTALGDYDRVQFEEAAEIGAHAQRKGRVDAVAQIVKLIQTTPPKEHEELRVKALVAIARAGAEHGRSAEAQKLLVSTTSFVNKLELTEGTPEILKNFAVTYAVADDIRSALRQISCIKEPYFITSALIDIGTLFAKKKLLLDVEDLKALNEIVGADLPPDVEPGRLINEAGWEIPGLAQGRMLRPPELQRTRDRTIELFYTFYEPNVETFIKRLLASRRKPKPEQAQWTSEGLKVSLIEERVISGHKFCYRVTAYEVFHDKSGLPKYTNDL